MTTDETTTRENSEVTSLEFSPLLLDDALDPEAKPLMIGVHEDRARPI